MILDFGFFEKQAVSRDGYVAFYEGADLYTNERRPGVASEYVML